MHHEVHLRNIQLDADKYEKEHHKCRIGAPFMHRKSF